MSAVQPAWKVISLLLGLGVFMGVGALSIATGDELLWSAAKAVGAFIASWIVLNYLGVLLNILADRPLDASDEAGGHDLSGNEEG